MISELEQEIDSLSYRAARCEEWARQCKRRGLLSRRSLLVRAAIRLRNDRWTAVMELRQARHSLGFGYTGCGGVSREERA
jgi:hypothetical protein